MQTPQLVKKLVFLLFAKRFVAGETIDDAIRAAKKLKGKNIYPIINILGEHVKNREKAIEFRNQYIKLIEKLAEEGFSNAHISIKPSQLGIEISEGLYQHLLFDILKSAQGYLPKGLVEIDRENEQYAESVFQVSLRLARTAKTFPNQRLACQVNLNRTLDEIPHLAIAGISARLCKGTAYQGDITDKEKIREIFFEQSGILARISKNPAAATHDLYLLDKLRGKNNLGFQALLGIENKEMEKLAGEGKEVGFYIPCGSDWWPYGKRRWKIIVKIWLRNWWYRIKG